MQCQEYRLVPGERGHVVPRQCRNQATATALGVHLCTVHLGALMVYGKSWFLRDGETWELLLPGGNPYPLAEELEQKGTA